MKRRKHRNPPPEATSGVQTPRASDLHPKKKAKTANNESKNQASSSASLSFSLTDKIPIGGGAVCCQGLEKAIRALCRHALKKKEAEDTQDLLAGQGGPTVCLMFSLQNIPDRQRVIPHLIELPYSPLDAGSEVCLIVRDPQRKFKDLVSSHSSLSSVTKVISYRKLPKKFPQFADKRALCAAYDLFLVDTTVKEKAYNTLGKVFFSANKLPLPIRVGVSTLEREVGRALRCTSLVLKRGPSVAVRIGKALGAPDELYANAVAAIQGVSNFFKQNPKWKNTVTTIHIQATNMPALPVYLHPKYAQAAEHYSQTKPPSASSPEDKKYTDKTNKQTVQETIKTPNKIKKARKIKRGVSDKEKKKTGEKPSKIPFKKAKSKKHKK